MEVIGGQKFDMRPVVEGETIAFAQQKVRTSEEGVLEVDGVVAGMAYDLFAKMDGQYRSFRRVLAPAKDVKEE